MKTKFVEIDGAVGKLSAIIQTPNMKEGETCPMVILMHGLLMSKEGPIMENLSNKLTAQRIGVIRLDFNGHGQSDDELVDKTIPR